MSRARACSGKKARRAVGGRLGLALLLAALAVSCGGGDSHRIAVEFDPQGSELRLPAGTRFLLVDADPNVLISLVQLKADYSTSGELLEKFRQALEEHALSTGQSDEAGRLAFEGVAPGHYWVVNPEPIASGGQLYLWSCPAAVADSLEDPALRLQLSNVALMMTEESVRLH